MANIHIMQNVCLLSVILKYVDSLCKNSNERCSVKMWNLFIYGQMFSIIYTWRSSVWFGFMWVLHCELVTCSNAC